MGHSSILADLERAVTLFGGQFLAGVEIEEPGFDA
jgi:hypothetical protein